MIGDETIGGFAENAGRCEVCQEPVPTHDLLGHLRAMHPDMYGEGPITWPDGGVVIEEDLAIQDFTGEAS